MRICPECNARTEDEHCPNDGRPTIDERRLTLDPQRDPFLDRVIEGKYRIEKRLGAGGFGAVYRASHVETGGKLAVKLVRSDLVQHEGVLRRFYLEAQNTHRLSHHNTVRLTDFGQTEDGVLFLAMEYVHGRPLSSVLEDEQRLAPARVARIGEQVLKSLGEAHELKLVHRDIKPDNIMLVDRFGEPDFVKVLDFGISRAIEGPGASTKGAIGTPCYMSPEQCRALPPDGRSDLYSLGCVLFELLTGRPPFVIEGHGMEQALAYLDAHVNETPPALLELAPGACSEVLAAFVMRLLAKDRADRPPSAGAALELLAGVKRMCALPEEVQELTGPLASDAGKGVETLPFEESGTPHQPTVLLVRGTDVITGTTETDQTEAETVRDTRPRRQGWLWAVPAVAMLGAAGVALALGVDGGDEPAASASGQVAQARSEPVQVPTETLQAEPEGSSRHEPAAPDPGPLAEPPKPDPGPSLVSEPTPEREPTSEPEPAPEPKIVSVASEPDGAVVTVKETGETVGTTPLDWTVSDSVLARLEAGESVTLLFAREGSRPSKHAMAESDSTVLVRLEAEPPPGRTIKRSKRGKRRKKPRKPKTGTRTKAKGGWEL